MAHAENRVDISSKEEGCPGSRFVEGEPGVGVGHVKSEIPFRHQCGDIRYTCRHPGKKFREVMAREKI